MKPHTRKTVELLSELMEYRISGSGNVEDIQGLLAHIQKWSGPLPVFAPKAIKMTTRKPATARKASVNLAVVVTDTSGMTDAELFKHHALTASLLDVEFFLTHAKPQGDVLAALEGLRGELQARPARPADRLAYRNLVQRHWREHPDRRTHTQCVCPEAVVSALGPNPMDCPACSFKVHPAKRQSRKAA
jgi:hypothetical protein